MSDDSIEAQFEANETEADALWHAGYDCAKTHAQQDLQDMERRLQNYAKETQEIASERNQLKLKAFKQKKRNDDLITAMRELKDSNFNLASLVKALAGPDDTTATAALLAANKADTRARALIGEDGK